jgi:hypothetical protein
MAEKYGDEEQRSQRMDALSQRIVRTERGSEWLNRVRSIGFNFLWDVEDDPETKESDHEDA